MKIHELKQIPPFFQDVWDGKKTFEIRFNDRDYKEGDLLILKEYFPDEVDNDSWGFKKGVYGKRSIVCCVKYMIYNTPCLKDNYCGMSIEPLMFSEGS